MEALKKFKVVRNVSLNIFLSGFLYLSLTIFSSHVAFAGTYGSGLYGRNSYAGVAPTVTTASPTSITGTTATLNGSITNIGTTSPTVRGFVYGTSVSYGATTTDSAGPFSTGSFAASVSSLTCNTAYNFAAYATSINGIGYGNDATFTTSACTVSGGQSNQTISGSRAKTSLIVPTVTTTNSKLIATTPKIPTFTFSKDLDLGSTGIDVKNLQVFLNTHGFPVSPSGVGSRGQESDYFGEKTRQALILFQKFNNIIPAIGYLGPKTKTFIANQDKSVIPIPPITPPVNVLMPTPFDHDLEQGDIDPQVILLQKYLNVHGFTIATEGPGSKGFETNIFGQLTKEALIKYQKSKNIKPTGNLGPITRKSME